ncbi:MAG: S26 family signal peptidase [Candidatus Bathyarchaeota archaeon]|nr:MAG: S26 family signal peptidase [Candidatus Bathyarchaeota archaeon]
MGKRVVLLVSLISLIIILGGTIGTSYLYIGEQKIYMCTSLRMQPILIPGDLVLVQIDLTIDDIDIGYGTGDIIVFCQPGDPESVLVARAVEKSGDGVITKGDNNILIDKWIVYDRHLIGKVVEVNSLPAIIFANQLIFIIIVAGLTIASILVLMTLNLKDKKE